MAFDQTDGTANIRTQDFNKIVKGFAEASYKFKQAVTISSTSAWSNYFYREASGALVGQAGNAIKGIPRNAEFPQAYETYDRILTTIQKYGLETNISWEDTLTDDIDLISRHLFRIAEGVAKAVDDQIYIDLGGTGTLSAVASFSVVGTEWDLSSAAIIDDLLKAKQIIAQANYDVSNLMLFVNPKDHRSIVNYLASKGAQFPSIGTDMATNGRAGNLVGMQIVISNSVTVSGALVVVPKICATWKEMQPLTTETKVDPYKSTTIRCAEVGVLQLTDPAAVIRIFGTQKNSP